MGRTDNMVILLSGVYSDMVLYDLLGGGMVFQLPVNLVRQLLPAVLAKDLCQLFFGQRIVRIRIVRKRLIDADAALYEVIPDLRRLFGRKARRCKDLPQFFRGDRVSVLGIPFYFRSLI